MFFHFQIQVRNAALAFNSRMLAFYIVSYFRLYHQGRIAVKVFIDSWNYQGTFITIRCKLYNFDHGSRLARRARERAKKLSKLGFRRRIRRCRSSERSTRVAVPGRNIFA